MIESFSTPTALPTINPTRRPQTAFEEGGFDYFRGVGLRPGRAPGRSTVHVPKPTWLSLPIAATALSTRLTAAPWSPRQTNSPAERLSRIARPTLDKSDLRLIAPQQPLEHKFRKMFREPKLH